MFRSVLRISPARRLLTNRNPSGKQDNLITVTQRRFTKKSGWEYKSGALKPKPEESRLAPLLVICAVIPGLFIGAQISKSVANFLEENDLFVPDDDDEDD